MVSAKPAIANCKHYNPLMTTWQADSEPVQALNEKLPTPLL